MLVVSVQRPTVEGYGTPIFSPQNVPLAITIIFIVMTLELRFRRIRSILLFPFVVSTIVFFVCSFGLPPVGPSSDYYSILSYGAVVYQLGVVIAALVWKTPGVFRTALLVVLAVALGTLAGFINTFMYSRGYTNHSDAKLAVVLGTTVLGPHTPGLLLTGRLNAALKLFKKGDIDKIAVTGAGQAGVEAWHLEHYGVPDSDLIVESPPTYCTSEQANFVKKVLVDSLNIKKVALVTDSWHLPRALLMCRWQGIEAVGIPSYTKMSILQSSKWRFHEAGALQLYILFGA